MAYGLPPPTRAPLSFPGGISLLCLCEKADAERFLGATPVSFQILFDPDNKVSGSYGVSAMPTTFLVDRQGRLRWQHRAYKPGDEAAYIEQIRAMLREKS